MPSHPDWEVFDGLLRELGSLRASTSVSDPAAVDAAVREAVDVLITRAADAVDRVADSPTEDQRIVTAWESILMAQDYIAALGDTAARSRQIVVQSVELRKRAVEAMTRAALLGKRKRANPPLAG